MTASAGRKIPDGAAFRSHPIAVRHKSFRIRSYAKFAHNPFRIRSYEKHGGGGGTYLRYLERPPVRLLLGYRSKIFPSNALEVPALSAKSKRNQNSTLAICLLLGYSAAPFSVAHRKPGAIRSGHAHEIRRSLALHQSRLRMRSAGRAQRKRGWEESAMLVRCRDEEAVCNPGAHLSGFSSY